MCVPDPRAAMFDFSDMTPANPTYAPDRRAEEAKREQTMKRMGMSALMRFLPSTGPVKILKKVI